jgi:hypothetical protein
MPEKSTSPGGSRPEELLYRRIEHLERENRWWRGGLIAALVFIGLMILEGGHHRRHIDVVVAMPPSPMRRPYWGYGPGPYPPPPPGWGGYGGRCASWFRRARRRSDTPRSAVPSGVVEGRLGHHVKVDDNKS